MASSLSERMASVAPPDWPRCLSTRSGRSRAATRTRLGAWAAVLVEMRKAHPALPVVVISASDRASDVIQAIDLGAMGFVPSQRASNDTLVDALRLVMAGGIYVPAMHLGSSQGPASRAASPAIPAAETATYQVTPSFEELGLTPRQADVLTQLLQGKPNKEIARRLGLSVETVKDHVQAVLRALGVSSRTQAVLAVSQMDAAAPRAPRCATLRKCWPPRFSAVAAPRGASGLARMRSSSFPRAWMKPAAGRIRSPLTRALRHARRDHLRVRRLPPPRRPSSGRVAAADRSLDRGAAAGLRRHRHRQRHVGRSRLVGALRPRVPVLHARRLRPGAPDLALLSQARRAGRAGRLARLDAAAPVRALVRRGGRGRSRGHRAARLRGRRAPPVAALLPLGRRRVGACPHAAGAPGGRPAGLPAGARGHARLPLHVRLLRADRHGHALRHPSRLARRARPRHAARGTQGTHHRAAEEQAPAHGDVLRQQHRRQPRLPAPAVRPDGAAGARMGQLGHVQRAHQQGAAATHVRQRLPRAVRRPRDLQPGRARRLQQAAEPAAADQAGARRRARRRHPRHRGHDPQPAARRHRLHPLAARTPARERAAHPDLPRVRDAVPRHAVLPPPGRPERRAPRTRRARAVPAQRLAA